MGRKKAVHPADAYRRKQRKREIKKNKRERQASRAGALRKKTEDELVHEIQKINTSESSGKADQRQLIRRKQLLTAFNEVQAKKKALEKAAHTAKTVTMKGFGKLLKIFGGDQKPDGDKENQTAELEFPPGIPRNPKLERPPGIVPRPQNSRRTRTFLKRKEDNLPQKQQMPARRNFGNVEIVNPHKLAQIDSRKMRRRGQMASELFDPLNPASPFYLDRPGQRPPPNAAPMQMQPPPPTAPRPAPPRQIGPQMPGPGNTPSGPQPAMDGERAARMGITAPAPAPRPAPIAGIGPPGGPQGYAMGPAMPAPARQFTYPGAQKQKLEVLLSDDMKSLIPTNLRVKRKAPASRRRTKKGLDIAPDVGGAKSAKKIDSKKKGGMAVNDAYDDFLTDLGDLA